MDSELPVKHVTTIIQSQATADQALALLRTAIHAQEEQVQLKTLAQINVEMESLKEHEAQALIEMMEILYQEMAAAHHELLSLAIPEQELQHQQLILEVQFAEMAKRKAARHAKITTQLMEMAARAHEQLNQGILDQEGLVLQAMHAVIFVEMES